jgi:hypothetical protein
VDSGVTSMSSSPAQATRSRAASQQANIGFIHV